MILYLAADLLWATKIKGTAEALGIPARPVRTLEMLEARLADCPVKALVVDLESPDMALALISHLRSKPVDPVKQRIQILAFGPHVAVEALQAAKAAGADAVMARGAFSGRLPQILQQLEDTPAGVGDQFED